MPGGCSFHSSKKGAQKEVVGKLICGSLPMQLVLRLFTHLGTLMFELLANF